MSEIIGDDHPTYEESVNMSLAERKKDSVHTYMTEVEHEINKQNVERLLKENFELRHRLACIADDIVIISNHIEENCNKKFKRPSLNPDGSVYADEAWHNVSNIEIACDLTDDAPLEWGSKVKGELTQDQIIEMEQQIR
tara:strand:- start:509 stop:925 length:417 start_codon:yes stop_codon:yes gene_type:complete